MLLRRSDRTLKQCFPSVRSDGDSVSGRSKTKEIACTGLWLHLVGVHRTRPIVILGVLDLSGIDQTLGGRVRSLPLERAVSRNHAYYELFPISFSILSGDPI